MLHDLKSKHHQFLCGHGALQRAFSRVRSRNRLAVEKLTPILAGRFTSGDRASRVRDIELKAGRCGYLKKV